MGELTLVNVGSFVQRRALWLAVAVFVVAGFAYTLKFISWPTSGDPAHWGQFGDYMGGLINPMIGLITIWLLSTSLAQNQTALSQANAALSQANTALEQSKLELELTRKAIQQAAGIQKATEDALSRQVAIAEESRDIANASSLWASLEQRRSNSVKRITENRYGSPYELERLQESINAAQKGLVKLEQIMATEIDRLDGKYNKPSA